MHNIQVIDVTQIHLRFNHMKIIYLIIILINLPLINDVLAQHIQNSANETVLFYKSKVIINSNVSKDSVIKRTEVKKNRPCGLKDPFVAAMLAIFPGVIVRGMGHFYAKKYITGGLLIMVAFFGLYFNKIDYYDASDFIYKQIQNDPPRYVAEISKHKHHEFLYYSSRILIFGSWAYDIIGAPIVCIRHNKRIKQKLSLNPYFGKNQLGNQVGIQLRYSF